MKNKVARKTLKVLPEHHAFLKTESAQTGRKIETLTDSALGSYVNRKTAKGAK